MLLLSRWQGRRLTEGNRREQGLVGQRNRVLGGPLGRPWLHIPVPLRPGPVSLPPPTSPLGSPPMVGEQLDLIREIMMVQRELQQQLVRARRRSRGYVSARL